MSNDEYWATTIHDSEDFDVMAWNHRDGIDFDFRHNKTTWRTHRVSREDALNIARGILARYGVDK